MQHIILRPIITEKTVGKSAENTSYTFAVGLFAPKNAIKQEVEKRFNVEVVGVMTSIVKGKTKKIGRARTEKTETEWKKATVHVKKGQKIALFEIGGQETK